MGRVCLRFLRWLPFKTSDHNPLLAPNFGTERRGRPSASALATDVARPRSLQRFWSALFTCRTRLRTHFPLVR